MGIKSVTMRLDAGLNNCLLMVKRPLDCKREIDIKMEKRETTDWDGRVYIVMDGIKGKRDPGERGANQQMYKKGLVGAMSISGEEGSTCLRGESRRMRDEERSSSSEQ